MPKHINKPISWVVVFKINGEILAFKRNSKNKPKPYSCMETAIAEVKRLNDLWAVQRHDPENPEDKRPWVAMTTWRLAEQEVIRV